MRVLILGPDHAQGSLPPYLDVLTDALRRAGATVDRHGSTAIPYDSARGRFRPLPDVLREARALLAGIDLRAYDLLSVHFGNLELDQLFPVLWADAPRPPAVYHVHTLDPTLLRTQIPDPLWYRAVRAALGRFDGYIYFGDYARRRARGLVNAEAPSQVAWLPTTIPPGTQPSPADPPDLPVVSLYGYAAPWKNAGLLHAAAARMHTPARIVLAGEFWDDPAQAGIDLRRVASRGAGRIHLVPGYLAAAERAALVGTSTVAVFPYQPHPSFQGSGAIADYLAHAVPVVATDVANMRELIGKAGVVVAPDDPAALAAALDQAVAGGATLTALTRAVRAHAARFTADTHVARCLELYLKVIGRRRSTRGRPG